MMISDIDDADQIHLRNKFDKALLVKWASQNHWKAREYISEMSGLTKSKAVYNQFVGSALSVNTKDYRLMLKS